MAIHDDEMEQVLHSVVAEIQQMYRRLRAIHGALQQMGANKERRAAIERLLNRQRFDPILDQKMRQEMSDAERTAWLEQQVQEAQRQRDELQRGLDEAQSDLQEAQEARQQEADLDVNGNGKSDILDAEQAAGEKREEEETADAVDERTQEADADARREQETEEAQADKRKDDQQKAAEQGVETPDAGTTAAGVGGALAAEELAEQAEAAEAGQDARGEGAEAETEQDIEVSDQGVVQPAGMDAQQTEQQFVNPDGTVNQAALDGQQLAEEQQVGGPEQGQEREVDAPGQEPVSQDVAANQSGLEGEGPGREQPRVDGPDQAQRNEVDGQDQRFVNDDGSVNQAALNGGEQETGEQGQQFVNDDGSVNQAALNGEEQDQRNQDQRDEELGQQGEAGPSPGLPTGGDRQLTDEVAERTSQDQDGQTAEQDGRVTPEPPENPAIAEARARGGALQESGTGTQMSDGERGHLQHQAHGGQAEFGSVERPDVAAAAGGRGGQTPGQQHAAQMGSAQKQQSNELSRG